MGAFILQQIYIDSYLKGYFWLQRSKPFFQQLLSTGKNKNWSKLLYL